MFNKDRNVQGSDATDDHSSNVDGLIKISTLNQAVESINYGYLILKIVCYKNLPTCH